MPSPVKICRRAINPNLPTAEVRMEDECGSRKMRENFAHRGGVPSKSRWFWPKNWVAPAMLKNIQKIR
jgi:hypothetical protein